MKLGTYMRHFMTKIKNLYQRLSIYIKGIGK